MIKFYSSIFNAEETNSMAKQIVLAITEMGSTDKILLKAKTAIEESNQKLTSVLNVQHSNPYTIELKKADDWRDDVHMGGRDVIKAMTQWVFDTDKMEAAMRLEKVFHRHGWSLQNYGYQKQSSAINSIISELNRPEYQKDLTTCNIISWFEAEKKGQEGFENLFNIKIGHENKQESTAKREAQLPVIENIKKLAVYLNSIILFNEGDTAWDDIYSKIEGIIKQATTTSRSRRAIHNEKPEVE